MGHGEAHLPLLVGLSRITAVPVFYVEEAWWPRSVDAPGLD
jgi:hypothetical protein